MPLLACRKEARSHRRHQRVQKTTSLSGPNLVPETSSKLLPLGKQGITGVVLLEAKSRDRANRVIYSCELYLWESVQVLMPAVRGGKKALFCQVREKEPY